MAISRIASGSAEADTVTIPVGHQAGDLLVMYAYRDGVATAPSVPEGWTSQISGTASSNAQRLSYKFAQSDAETSGTWTNATELICVVYRGVDFVTPIANLPTTSSGTSTTVTYGTKIVPNPFCWVVGAAGHASTGNTLETPPTNMVLVQDQSGATASAAAHDTDGPVDFWPSTNVAVGGSSLNWMSYTFALIPVQTRLGNYLGVDVGDGMSATEKIR